MFYELTVTFQGRTVIAIKLDETENIPTPPVKQLDKTETTETVGYYFEGLKGAANLFKAHARSKEEAPNLMWEFLAWEDAKTVYEKIVKTAPELLI